MEKQEGLVIDVDALMWRSIKQAAQESTWMPKEYFMNDWVSDVEKFLRDGALGQTSVHLIEAAPDLLAALKDILPLAENGAATPGHEGFCGPEQACDCECMAAYYDSQVLMRAREAITKAEGKVLAP